MLKKLSSLISIDELKNTAVRFPVPVLCSVLLFVLGFAEINNLWRLPNEIAQNLFVSLIAGFFLSGAVHLMGEARPLGRLKTIGFAVLAVAVVSILIFVTERGQEERFFILILSTIAFVLVAPFIGRQNDDLSFWCFARQVGFGAAISFIAALILFGGASGALASIGYLFEVKIHHDIYSTLWLFGASLVAPLYALSFVPSQFETKAQECHLPSQVGFIANWILAPLVAIYIAILYAYFIKIGVTGDIPKNQLANMIVGFGFAGIATYLIAWPFTNDGSLKSNRANALLKGVMKYLFPLLLIPVLVMVYAIMIRVFEYGMTEKRYIVVVSALWLLFLIGGFIAKKLQLKHIILSFAVLLFLSVVGPWGMTPVSQASQFNRLEKTLTALDILQEGEIVKAQKDLSFEDRKNISSKLTYLQKTEYYDEIIEWFTDEQMKTIKNDINENKTTYPSNLTSLMGFEFVHRYANDHNNESFYLNGKGIGHEMFAVRGYDYIMINRNAYIQKDGEAREIVTKAKGGAPEVKWRLDEQGILKVTVQGRGSLDFDISTFAKEQKGKNNQALILEEFGLGMKIRLVFGGISGKIKDEVYHVQNIRFAMLLDL